MIQRFHRPIATYLSTNHPVLWVARFDIAILMAGALALLGIPIVWTAGATTVSLLERVLETYDQIPAGAVAILDNIQISLQLLTAALGIVAALLWFGAVYRSAYKAVAPAMRIYPRVIDLFAALALIGFVTASIIVILDLAMARGDAGSSYASQTEPSWILAKYLMAMIEPAVLLSMIFALILRWSIGAALGLTVGALIIAVAGAWVTALILDNIAPQARDSFGNGFIVLFAVACLFVPLWIARSRRNSKARRLLVALCIPMAVIAVAGLELCFMFVIEYLTRTGRIMGYQVFPFLGANQEYGPHYFFFIHSAVTLLFVEWIYVRWARLSLRPE
jgi:hypothetical protein